MRPITASLTKLQLHDVILLDGALHRVDLVNDCRARCIPTARRLKTYVPQTGRDAGKEIAFSSCGPCISISPNAECEVLGRWLPETQTIRLACRAGAQSEGRAGSTVPVPLPVQGSVGQSGSDFEVQGSKFIPEPEQTTQQTLL